MADDTTTRHRSPATAVSGERLWQRHMSMAKIGATKRGGVNRQTLTPEDAEARALLIRWASERQFECWMDDIGNMFVRRPGSDAAAPPVMTGSHLDTQPSGGKFDGVYGVLAGLEALEAIADQGLVTRRPIEVAVWTNEEGCRFDQGCMGSQVFVDPSKLARMLAFKDAGGISVADALQEVRQALPTVRRRLFGFAVDTFIEAHIEQGPILEAEGKTIGVVTGIQGSRRFLIEVEGEDAHAGTTPRRRRKDALFAAVDMVTQLRDLMTDPEDIVRFTIGRFEVSPNALAVVPGRVAFTVDFRHPEEEVLARLGDQIEPICRANAGPCSVVVTETRRAASKQFEGLVPETILAVTEELGFSHMHIPSGAGHDARYLADICEAGMIFVPCEKGISHNEVENAAADDLAAGTRVLVETLVRLANR